MFIDYEGGINGAISGSEIINNSYESRQTPNDKEEEQWEGSIDKFLFIDTVESSSKTEAVEGLFCFVIYRLVLKEEEEEEEEEGTSCNWWSTRNKRPLNSCSSASLIVCRRCHFHFNIILPLGIRYMAFV